MSCDHGLANEWACCSGKKRQLLDITMFNFPLRLEFGLKFIYWGSSIHHDDMICYFLPFQGHGSWQCSALGCMVYQQFCTDGHHNLIACCCPERWKDSVAQQPSRDFPLPACVYDCYNHAVFLDLCVFCPSKRCCGLWRYLLLCYLSPLCCGSVV